MKKSILLSLSCDIFKTFCIKKESTRTRYCFNKNSQDQKILDLEIGYFVFILFTITRIL